MQGQSQTSSSLLCGEGLGAAAAAAAVFKQAWHASLWRCCVRRTVVGRRARLVDLRGCTLSAARGVQLRSCVHMRRGLEALGAA